MKPALETIVRLLEAEIGKQARCAIADYGCPDESTLMGTRDGLLNLALTLVRIVYNNEKFLPSDGMERADKSAQPPQSDGHWISEENAYWSGIIKRAFYQLPTNSPFIVGCCLFPDHENLLNALEKSVEADLPEGVKLRNDPDFASP